VGSQGRVDRVLTRPGAQVGVAFLDAAARRAGACEFADDEHFCSLEAVLLQLGAKEVVLPKARAGGRARSARAAHARGSSGPATETLCA